MNLRLEFKKVVEQGSGLSRTGQTSVRALWKSSRPERGREILVSVYTVYTRKLKIEDLKFLQLRLCAMTTAVLFLLSPVLVPVIELIPPEVPC